MFASFGRFLDLFIGYLGFMWEKAGPEADPFGETAGSNRDPFG